MKASRIFAGSWVILVVELPSAKSACFRARKALLTAIRRSPVSDRDSVASVYSYRSPSLSNIAAKVSPISRLGFACQDLLLEIKWLRNQDFKDSRSSF